LGFERRAAATLALALGALAFAGLDLLALLAFLAAERRFGAGALFFEADFRPLAAPFFALPDAALRGAFFAISGLHSA
jgi:hypothetical protein